MSVNDSYLYLPVSNTSLTLNEIVPFFLRIVFWKAEVTVPKALLLLWAVSLGPLKYPNSCQLISAGSLIKPENLELQLVLSESKLWPLYSPLTLLSFNVKLALSLTLLDGV